MVVIEAVIVGLSYVFCLYSTGYNISITYYCVQEVFEGTEALCASDWFSHGAVRESMFFALDCYLITWTLMLR